MTKEEYYKKREELDLIHKQNILKLNRECANSNNTHKVGDLITDHTGTIRIENIVVNHNTFGDSLPAMNYNGIMINKNGSENKRGEKRTIHQSNITTI